MSVTFIEICENSTNLEYVILKICKHFLSWIFMTALKRIQIPINSFYMFNNGGLYSKIIIDLTSIFYERFPYCSEAVLEKQYIFIIFLN